MLTDIDFQRLFDTANKLKHANRDPHEPLCVPPDKDNEGRIGLAIVMYRMLGGDLTAEMGAFHLMSLFAYPDEFQVAADVDPDIEHGSVFGAALLREDVELRRVMVRALQNNIAKGLIPANVKIRRRNHSSAPVISDFTKQI